MAALEVELQRLRAIIAEKSQDVLRLDTINKGLDREYQEYRVDTKIQLDQMAELSRRTKAGQDQLEADLHQLLNVKGQIDEQFNITKTANAQLFELNQNLLKENKQLKLDNAEYILKVKKLKKKLSMLKRAKTESPETTADTSSRKRSKMREITQSATDKMLKISCDTDTNQPIARFSGIKRICRTVQLSGDAPPLPPPGLSTFEPIQLLSSDEEMEAIPEPEPMTPTTSKAPRRVVTEESPPPSSTTTSDLHKSWTCEAPLSESESDNDEDDGRKYLKYNVRGTIWKLSRKAGIIESKTGDRYYFLREDEEDGEELDKGDSVKFDVIRVAADHDGKKVQGCNLRVIGSANNDAMINISTKLKSRLG